MKYITDTGPHVHSIVNLKVNNFIKAAGLIMIVASLIFSVMPALSWYVNSVIAGLLFYGCNLLDNMFNKKQEFKDAARPNVGLIAGIIWIILFMPITSNILLMLFCIITGYLISIGVNKLLDKELLNKGLVISLIMVFLCFLGKLEGTSIILLKTSGAMIYGYFFVSIIFLLTLLLGRNMKWRLMLGSMLSLLFILTIAVVLGITTFCYVLSPEYIGPFILLLVILLVTSEQTPVRKPSKWLLGLITAIIFTISGSMLPIALSVLITVNICLALGTYLDLIKYPVRKV